MQRSETDAEIHVLRRCTRGAPHHSDHVHRTMYWVPPNVSMAPTCFGTVIDVPGAIKRRTDRAVRGGPFDLTSGRDGAICCRDCCRKKHPKADVEGPLHLRLI